MGIRESLLNTISSVSDSDFVRIATAAGASSKVTVSNLAKTVVENYNGSSLGGSARTIKAAIDALQTATNDHAHVYRKARTYSNITIPSDGYVKIDSFADMGVSTSLYLMSITITGWTGTGDKVPRIVKGGNGVDIYAIGPAGSYSGFNVQYFFADTVTTL